MGCGSCEERRITSDGRAGLLVNVPQMGVLQTSHHPVRALHVAIPDEETPYRPQILEDGSILYEENDLPPPPDINGYQRDQSYPWLFHPLWSKCRWRLFGLRRHSTLGMVNIVAICQNKEAPTNTKYVTCRTCDQCPLAQSSSEH